ncbi:MAG: ribosome recycling factor [Candidatus Harrisonbacteria bacterium]|nr:ribosome recycling factor [Candidatus Harrisonbacteria bacterium]
METVIKQIQSELAQNIEHFKKELSAIRTSRPNPALVEDIEVEAYGQKMPLKQVGSISIVPPREIVITLWDPSNINQIAKSLEESKRGFNAQVRGASIHINLPQLSQERREELIRFAKSQAENIRIQIRSHRDQANKAIDKAEKEGEINEDQKFKARETVQKAVDGANSDIEKALELKISELNE